MEMYVSKERVERDGFLIAYEGEVMSMEDAEDRGLLEAPKKGTKAALIAEDEAKGIEVPDSATKAEIEALLEEEPLDGGE